MTYQSVTTWQAEGFEIEVRYGFFSTPEAAAEMARNGIELMWSAFPHYSGLAGEVCPEAKPTRLMVGQATPWLAPCETRLTRFAQPPLM